MERTERTIEDWYYDDDEIHWPCPECKIDLKVPIDLDTSPRGTCACGYVWQVEVRPRFYITRE